MAQKLEFTFILKCCLRVCDCVCESHLYIVIYQMNFYKLVLPFLHLSSQLFFY